MNRKLAAAAAVLLILTAGLAVLHNAARPQIPEGTLLVQTSRGDVCLAPDKLPVTSVTGEIINGKGETKPINGEGISLKDALLAAGVDSPNRVTAVAGDEYSAAIEREELDGDRVYLLIEEGEVRLVVFGDPNSRRNVSHLIRLIVE